MNVRAELVAILSVVETVDGHLSEGRVHMSNVLLLGAMGALQRVIESYRTTYPEELGYIMDGLSESIDILFDGSTGLARTMVLGIMARLDAEIALIDDTERELEMHLQEVEAWEREAWERGEFPF